MSRCYCNCDDCCHYKEDLDGTDVLTHKDELLREAMSMLLNGFSNHPISLGQADDLITRIRKEVGDERS